MKINSIEKINTSGFGYFMSNHDKADPLVEMKNL